MRSPTTHHSQKKIPTCTGFLIFIGLFAQVKSKIKRMKRFITAICLLLTAVAIAQPQKDFLAANTDPTVSPATDFFLYANGGWIKRSPIPPGESSWSIGNLVQEEIYTRILDINTKAAAAKADKGTTTQKIGDFWLSGMDTVARNKAGLSPIKNDLAGIDKISSYKDLTKAAASLHFGSVNCFFSDYAAQDDKNSEVMVFKLDQGGLGMPNREYYLQTDARTLKVRQAYRKYMTLTFQQLGYSPAKAAAAMTAVYELEKKMAIASRKLEDLRDPYLNYNKMTLAQLNTLCPAIDWIAYAKYAVLPTPNDSVVVGQPDFFKALSRLMINTPIAVWKDYIKFQLVMNLAEFLDHTSDLNYFNYRRSLTGASVMRPRWKRVLDIEEAVMGELLGQLFASAYFNEKAKARYNNLVEAIRDSYADRLRSLSWISDATRQRALEKLQKVEKKVGYPDKWKDFSALDITPDSYAKNIMRASIFWRIYNISKMGKPVDRTEWQITPQTYNAYYNPGNNEIVLPAGIFAVPGMKDEDLDDAFVYGYAGASTIGHEITHGFDDQGRQYDAVGNLKDWWTKEDVAEFNKRASAIIAQFNEFVPVDTLHVNGEVTQGENIADLGGLVIGLDAYKKTDEYKAGKRIGGLTPLQRYFLGYAFGWMSHSKKERLALLVMTDVHAPAKERVNGPVVNIPEFYEAFGVKPTDKMYRDPAKRVSIW
jgi:putative endopeptidase